MTDRPKCGMSGPWNWVCSRDYFHMGWHSCIRDNVLCEWVEDALAGVPVRAFKNGEPVELPS